MEIFGIPLQAFLGQLLLGLVNGSFYAMLSLGLAVIFGLLNVINFAHGALYMMGAFFAWMGMAYFNLNYWVMLLLAPLLVGAFGILIEKTMLRWLYKLDHLYGLLLTFGITLMLEGIFRSIYGVSGQPYSVPEALQGATNLGFMILPNYRAWVVVASLVVCFATWIMIEKQSWEPCFVRVLKPATRGGLRYQCALDGDAHLWIRSGTGCICGCAGCAGYSNFTVDGLQPHHHRVCGGGDWWNGIYSGFNHHRAHLGYCGRIDPGVLSRVVSHSGVHHHGDCAHDSPGRSVRSREIKGSTR